MKRRVVYALAIAYACSGLLCLGAGWLPNRTISITTTNQSSRYVIARYVFKNQGTPKSYHLNPGQSLALVVSVSGSTVYLQYFPSNPDTWSLDGTGVSQAVSLGPKTTQLNVTVVDGTSGNSVLSISSVTQN